MELYQLMEENISIENVSVEEIIEKLMYQWVVNHNLHLGKKQNVPEEEAYYDIPSLIFLDKLIDGFPIRSHEKETIEILEEDFQFNRIVINRLFEYISERKGLNFNRNYILAIAKVWKNNNVKTLEEVNKIIKDYNKS